MCPRSARVFVRQGGFIASFKNRLIAYHIAFAVKPSSVSAAVVRFEMVRLRNTASAYLKQQSKPMTTPVTVLKEGQSQPLFNKIFAN